MSFETSAALLFIDGHAQRSDILAMYIGSEHEHGKVMKSEERREKRDERRETKDEIDLTLFTFTWGLNMNSEREKREER